MSEQLLNGPSAQKHELSVVKSEKFEKHYRKITIPRQEKMKC